MQYSISDVLGDEGRKALDACVKVKIFGWPENIAKYHWDKAWKRIEECYEGYLSLNYGGYGFLQRLILPTETSDRGGPREEKICDIIDIHNGLEILDEMLYVEKYPKPGPGSEERRKSIDVERADVEREFEEARANPEAERYKYSWLVAQRRVRDCFAGSFAGDFTFLNYESTDPNKLYDIVDIYDAVAYYDRATRFDKFYCDVYDPPYIFWPSPVRVEEERENIKKELAQAELYHDIKPSEYSKAEADQRVRNCYTYYPRNEEIFPIKLEECMSHFKQTFDIFDIQKAVQHYDKMKLVQKYPEDAGPGTDELRKSIEKNNFEVKKEYEKAICGLHRYSRSDAEKMLRGCFLDNWPEEVGELFSRESNMNQTYNICDIHKMLVHLDLREEQEKLRTTKKLIKHSEEDTRWTEVKKNRDAISRKFEVTKRKLGKYPRSEAERKVRDCFAGTLVRDVDIFVTNKKENNQASKSQQTYNIFDIKKAVDYFDLKKLSDDYRYLAVDGKESSNSVLNGVVDEKRAEIKEEYAKATTKIEIDHGSGFIVHDHFVITNKHVIDDANTEKNIDGKPKEVCICNPSIGELRCKIAHVDAATDLALLYCQELNSKQCGITPLHLSSEPLLPGMEIYSVGYPVSHTGKTALFVNGRVSGHKETYSDCCPSLAVLNLSLNCGNSGGPILRWIGNQLKVVGVATEKHIKDILTLEERGKIEKLRESLQTITMSDISDDAIHKASFECERSVRVTACGYCLPDPCQIPMFLLTLKLYDALESRSQFNLSNALPGDNVIKFIEEATKKCNGKHIDELKEVKWSADHNILPSGQHSASDCCIQ